MPSSLACFLSPSRWSCTVNSAALCPALGRCWGKLLARRLIVLPASGGWTTRRLGDLRMTWANEPLWGSCPTPASPCCCRNPSTSLGRAMTRSTSCGGLYETWGRTEKASFTICCDRLQRITLMHASTSLQRTGWTTATWSLRRRREKTGELDLSSLRLFAHACWCCSLPAFQCRPAIYHSWQILHSVLWHSLLCLML